VSQQDCLDYLKEEKKANPERWLMVKDIQDGLKQKGLGNGTLRNVANDLYMLMRFGDIEWRGIGVWKHHKEFRAK
jgi:hypothetical protein